MGAHALGQLHRIGYAKVPPYLLEIGILRGPDRRLCGRPGLLQLLTPACFAAGAVTDEPAVGIDSERMGRITRHQELKQLPGQGPLAGVHILAGQRERRSRCLIVRQSREHRPDLGQQSVRICQAAHGSFRQGFEIAPRL